MDRAWIAWWIEGTSPLTAGWPFGMLPQIKVPPFCKHRVVADPADDALDVVPD
jgi:hypothetical protein